MLVHLELKNFLLVNALSINLRGGLTAITGETGAGKSIIFNALSLLLGGRSDVTMIRPGQVSCHIAATWQNIGPETLALLDAQSIEYQDTLIIRRVIHENGASKSFVNDVSVTLQFLKSLGDTLVTIQQQFDPLLEPSKFMGILDQYGAFDDLLTQVSLAYTQWHDAEGTLKRARINEAKRSEDMESRRLLFEGLEALQPQPDEEVALMRDREWLRQGAARTEAYTNAHQALSFPSNVEAQVSEAQRILSKILVGLPQASRSNDSEELPEQTLAKMLESCRVDLCHIQETLAAFLADEEDSLAKLEKLDDRLAELRACAKLHRIAISDLHGVWKDLRDDFSEDASEDLKSLESAERQAYAQYAAIAEELSHLRKQAASRFCNEIRQHLGGLKLEHTRLDAVFNEKKQPNMYGKDEATLWVQPNPGLPMAPLQKSASGGEKSRILLAFRLVLGKKQAHNLYIFDEIDSGMSGNIVSNIGQKLKQLTHTDNFTQVLAITHSPQIAAFADCHLYVAKETGVDLAYSTIFELDAQAKLNELARMIAGQEVTEAALDAAAILLGEAKAA